MRVFRKFRASDGRIKIATLSGVSALVAVIALLVGVLPVMADHDTSLDDDPAFVQYGGGSGACDFVEVDSAADNELHINNPASGPFTGPDGTVISITVTGNLFRFDVVTPGIAVYDVVVNGGAHNLHYDYDGDENVGAVTSDKDLHAPTKSNGDPFNLSHINICYDGDTEFQCNDARTLSDENGLVTDAKATIFTNSVVSCPEEGKLGSFFIDGDTVTLDFGSGDGVIAGRLDVTKDFTQDDSPADPTDFENLEYDGSDNFTGFDDVEWCETRPFKDGDGTEFSDWLPTGTTDGSYPELPDGESACKVAEDEDLSGTQFTVVYFEFEDPQFR